MGAGLHERRRVRRLESCLTPASVAGLGAGWVGGGFAEGGRGGCSWPGPRGEVGAAVSLALPHGCRGGAEAWRTGLHSGSGGGGCPGGRAAGLERAFTQPGVVLGKGGCCGFKALGLVSGVDMGGRGLSVTGSARPMGRCLLLCWEGCGEALMAMVGGGAFCNPSPGNLLMQTRWPGLPGGRPYSGPVDCRVLWDPR